MVEKKRVFLILSFKVGVAVDSKYAPKTEDKITILSNFKTVIAMVDIAIQEYIQLY